MVPRLLLSVTHPLTARVLLRGQFQALRDAGFEVGLVVGEGAESLGEAGDLSGVTIFRIPLERRISPGSDLQAWYHMRAAIRTFRPSIINAGTPKAGVLGMLAARAEQVPARVYTIRGLPLQTRRGAMRRVLLVAERRAAHCAHRVVCVSESLSEIVLDLGITKREKVLVLGPGSSNGVDLQRFHPTDQAGKEEARRALFLPPDGLLIGFVGRLTKDKGIADLADIFCRQILHRFPDSRLLLAGAFEPEDPIPDRLRLRLESHPRVHVTGFLEKPELAYHAMDVLAFPSYREGFPNAVLEAGASMVPVAGYRSTGTVDAVASGQTGTLVGTGETEALADVLRRYLADRELRQRHGRSARERAIALFGQELVWDRWIDFYRVLLRQVAGT